MEANLVSAPQDLAGSSGPQFEPVRKSPLERLFSIVTDVRDLAVTATTKYSGMAHESAGIL